MLCNAELMLCWQSKTYIILFSFCLKSLNWNLSKPQKTPTLSVIFCPCYFQPKVIVWHGLKHHQHTSLKSCYVVCASKWLSCVKKTLFRSRNVLYKTKASLYYTSATNSCRNMLFGDIQSQQQMPRLENLLTYSHTRCARELCACIRLDTLGPQLTQMQSGKKIMLNCRLKDALRLNKEYCC